MADLGKAYQFLNEALGIGLGHEEMSRIEMLFKVKLAREQGFRMSEEQAKNFGAFVYFKPRDGMAIRANSDEDSI